MAQAVGELAQGARLPHARENLGGPRKKSRPAELVEIVSALRATPPEYAAQSLIALVNRGLITDSEWQQELLEEAFFLAGKAKYPYALQQIEGSETDTRAGSLSRGLSDGGDTLSLRTAVLEAMFKISPLRTRELLIEMLPIKLEVIACDQALRPSSIKQFYGVAAKVFQEGYTSLEQTQLLHMEFAERLLREAVHPLQVSGAAQLVRAIPPFETHEGKSETESKEISNRWWAQRTQLLDLYRETMRDSVVDTRGFALSSAVNEFVNEFVVLISDYQWLKIPIDETLITGREWLVRQYKKHSCAPSANIAELSELPVALKDYNSVMKALSSRPLEPIKPEELVGTPSLTKAVGHRYWQTPQTKALLIALKSLRFGPMEKQLEQIKAGQNPPPLTIEERNTLDWQRQLNEFLQSMEKWKPEDEASPLDYFHQRCITYGALIELTPAGSMRERLLGEYLSFLQTQRWQQDSFIEWLWHIRSMPKRFTPAEQDWLYERFAASPDHTLQLEAKLNRLLAPTNTKPKNN